MTRKEQLQDIVTRSEKLQKELREIELLDHITREDGFRYSRIKKKLNDLLDKGEGLIATL